MKQTVKTKEGLELFQKNEELEKVIDKISILKNSSMKGKNVLIILDGNYHLLKYESVELGDMDPFTVRASRHTKLICMGNLLLNRPDDPLTHKDPKQRVTKELKMEILGTHRMDFKKDLEFNLHLPSAEEHTDLYIRLAKGFADNHAELNFENFEILFDESKIDLELRKIIRPKYFEENVLPFLENRPTRFTPPIFNRPKSLVKKGFRLFSRKTEGDKRKPFFINFNMLHAREWYENATQFAKDGDFVYVGSKEEVYLFSLAKDRSGIYYQGTYTASRRPPLYFSNNYLGYLSARSMSKPLFAGSGPCNVAEYKTSNPPEFEGKSFVFSKIGREQNCKNTVFSGEPELITTDLTEALNHFQTTDFSEFIDLIETYHKKCNSNEEIFLEEFSKGIFI